MNNERQALAGLTAIGIGSAGGTLGQ